MWSRDYKGCGTGVRHSADSKVAIPHRGSCSLSSDLTADDTSATGSRRLFAPMLHTRNPLKLKHFSGFLLAQTDEIQEKSSGLYHRKEQNQQSLSKYGIVTAISNGCTLSHRQSDEAFTSPGKGSNIVNGTYHDHIGHAFICEHAPSTLGISAS